MEYLVRAVPTVELEAWLNEAAKHGWIFKAMLPVEGFEKLRVVLERQRVTTADVAETSS